LLGTDDAAAAGGEFGPFVACVDGEDSGSYGAVAVSLLEYCWMELT